MNKRNWLLSVGSVLATLVFWACSNQQANGKAPQTPQDRFPDTLPEASEAVKSFVSWKRPARMGVVGAGVPDVWVRPGFKIELVASKLRNPRFLALTADGNLIVSRTPQKDVLTLKRQSNGSFQVLGTFVSDLINVAELQVVGNEVYFTQSRSIWKAKVGRDGAAVDKKLLIGPDRLEGDTGHFWRPILVTDDAVYTGIGDPGNISNMVGTQRGKILKFDRDFKDFEVYATGLRNTEKLLIKPGTNDLYGFDHGSDNWGFPVGDTKGKQPFTDFNPNEELNLIVKGGFYGHPYIMANRVPRYEFVKQPDLVELGLKTIPPVYAAPAHAAPNGFTFYTGKMFPEMTGNIVVCYHGSWNRSVASGYRVSEVLFDDATQRPIGERPLAVMLDKDGRSVGRPVDAVVDTDGSILFSDEGSGGNIYRLSRV